jgi:hypothetical protein
MLPFKRCSKLEYVPDLRSFILHNFPIKYSKYLFWLGRGYSDELKINFLEKEYNLYTEILKDMAAYRITKTTEYLALMPINDLLIFNDVILQKYGLNISWGVTITEISQFEVFYSNKTSGEYAQYILLDLKKTEDNLTKEYKKVVDNIIARNKEIYKTNNINEKENYDIMQFNNNFNYIIYDCSTSLGYKGINYRFDCKFNNKNAKCFCHKHDNTRTIKRKYQNELDDIDENLSDLDCETTEAYDESSDEYKSLNNVSDGTEESDKPSDGEEASNYIKRTDCLQLNKNHATNNIKGNVSTNFIKKRTIKFKRARHSL